MDSERNIFLTGPVTVEEMTLSLFQDLRLALTYVGKIRDKLRNIGDLRPLSVSPDLTKQQLRRPLKSVGGGSATNVRF